MKMSKNGTGQHSNYNIYCHKSVSGETLPQRAKATNSMYHTQVSLINNQADAAAAGNSKRKRK